MKKVKLPTSSQTDFEKLQTFLEKKFTAVENQINNLQKNQKELDHNQKISDQKNEDSFREVRLKIFTESASTRRDLEKTFRAEIQVGNNELQKELSSKLDKVYKSLFERITFVADLVTVQLGDKIQTHEKRIKKLEQAASS